MAGRSTATATRPPLVLVGAESVGKTSLAALLTGARSKAQNLAGSTLAVESYLSGGRLLLDTPGLAHRGDTETTRRALAALQQDAEVVLVVRATHLDEELAHLSPLVAGRRGVVAVTHWDRVDDSPAARRALAMISADLGAPLVPLDARRDGENLVRLKAALGRPGAFRSGPLLARAGWRVEPPASVLDRPGIGPPLAALGLLAPAVAAVWLAVTVAGALDPYVTAATERAASTFTGLPDLAQAVVGGDYGLLTMGPLLLVWALPTVLMLALVLAVLRASGLLDRMAVAVHPLLRPFGLSGHDAVRVIAGFGCNVPAVLATRSCTACNRDGTIATIAFGSACSYQLAATLGVLAAARRPGLVVPYLLLLVGGALLHARLLRRRVDRLALDLHLLRGRAFLSRPRLQDIRREASATLRHVTARALPVFLAITLAASLAAATGLTERLGAGLAPVLALLRLPAEAAVAVALASLRKDGLLLLAEPSLLDVMDGAQLLAALLLAGALVPCLVTAATVWRERGTAVTANLLARQAGLALLLAAAVAWSGTLIGWGQ